MSGSQTTAAASGPTAPWDEFVDGRLRRLLRGKDYRGDGNAVVREARAAAQEHGKQAVAYRDRVGSAESVWVQFMDGSIRDGDPCPRCGSTTMHRSQRYFFRCPSCGGLYDLASADAQVGADIEGVVEFLGARLLSADGQETDELGREQPALVEVRYRFERALAGIHPSVSFLSGTRLALRSGCPDVLAVPEPQSLHVSLHLDGGLLAPGEYSIEATIHIVVETHDTHFLKLNVVVPEPFRVMDRHAADERPTQDAERTALHWTVVAGAEGQPAPAVVKELRALRG
jgi:hypothetical protein